MWDPPGGCVCEELCLNASWLPNIYLRAQSFCRSAAHRVPTALRHLRYSLPLAFCLFATVMVAGPQVGGGWLRRWCSDSEWSIYRDDLIISSSASGLQRERWRVAAVPTLTYWWLCGDFLPDHQTDPTAGFLAGARKLRHALRLPDGRGGVAGVFRRRPGTTDHFHRWRAGVLLALACTRRTEASRSKVQSTPTLIMKLMIKFV